LSASNGTRDTGACRLCKISRAAFARSPGRVVLCCPDDSASFDRAPHRGYRLSMVPGVGVSCVLCLTSAGWRIRRPERSYCTAEYVHRTSRTSTLPGDDHRCPGGLDHRGADRPQQHPGEPAAAVAADDGARKSARSSESLTWMANSVRGDAAYRLQFETPFKTAARRLRTGRRSSSPDASQLTGAPTTPIPTSAPAHPRTPKKTESFRFNHCVPVPE